MLRWLDTHWLLGLEIHPYSTTAILVTVHPEMPPFSRNTLLADFVASVHNLVPARENLSAKAKQNGVVASELLPGVDVVVNAIWRVDIGVNIKVALSSLGQVFSVSTHGVSISPPLPSSLQVIVTPADSSIKVWNGAVAGDCHIMHCVYKFV